MVGSSVQRTSVGPDPPLAPLQMRLAGNLPADLSAIDVSLKRRDDVG